jgi:hypothetical protein
MENEKRIRYAIIIMSIISVWILVTFPVLADETEWADPQENVLRLSESFVKDNFVIEATDFYEDSVLMTVYIKNDNNNSISDNNKIDSNIMRFGDSWNVSLKDSTINIVIKDFREDKGSIGAYMGLNVTVDQWANVLTRMIGKPLPMISIVPEERHIENRTIVQRVFTPGSEATINFTVKNLGKARLKDLGLSINTTLQLLYHTDKSHYDLLTLEAGNYTTTSVRFRVPDHIGNFSIFAETNGIDFLGRKYYDNDSTYIVVKPRIEKLVELTKNVPEKVYMGDITYAVLTIKNNGNNNVSANIIDGVPSGFDVIYENMSVGNVGKIDEMSLDTIGRTVSWNISLEGNREKVITYKMRSKKPGIYKFGAVCANIEEIEIECSNAPNKISNGELIVSGPYVELTKSFENVGGNDVRIKIRMDNKGDRTAIVRLADYVPRNYTLTGSIYRGIDRGIDRGVDRDIDGDSNISINKSDLSEVIFKPIILRSQGSSSIGYVLHMHKDGNVSDYRLPPAEAAVFDQFLYSEDRYIQKIISNGLIVR